jgi:hypothetical protein
MQRLDVEPYARDLPELRGRCAKQPAPPDVIGPTGADPRWSRRRPALRKGRGHRDVRG